MTTAYNDTQFSDEMADGMQYWWWYSARNKTILTFIRKYNLDNILDVGCGRGIVTTYLYNKGVNITGVELGKTTPIIESPLKIYFGTDALSLPEEFCKTVNTISLFDVIEHIEEPVTFLRSLFNKYPNANNLMMTVPSRKELWSNLDSYYGHFRRYDFTLLKKEMDEAGFEIVYSSYFFNTTYLVMGLYNKLFKQWNVKLHPPKSMFSKSFHKLVASIFYIESLIVPGKIFGSSIVCICRKKC